MATKKISELDAAAALTGTETVEVVQGGANVKTTTQDIADLGGGGGGGTSPVVTDATANRDITAAGVGSYIRMTKADGDKTVTFRPEATEALPANGEWHIRCIGNQTTLTPGSGVTLNAPSGGTLVLTAGMTVTVKRVAEDEFDVIGQTVAA